jgi:hypothetical protein
MSCRSEEWEGPTTIAVPIGREVTASIARRSLLFRRDDEAEVEAEEEVTEETLLLSAGGGAEGSS